MGLGAIRRYDVQARYALVLAVVSAVPLLGDAALLVRNYQRELGQIVYGSAGKFVPLFLGCLLLSMVLAGLAFVLGWSSAGQRRNDKPVYSWVGFFLGGGVVTANIILLIAFWMLRFQQPV